MKKYFDFCRVRGFFGFSLNFVGIIKDFSNFLKREMASYEFYSLNPNST